MPSKAQQRSRLIFALIVLGVICLLFSMALEFIAGLVVGFFLLALAGALLFERDFQAQWGEFKLAISPEQLRRSTAKAARGAGYSEEQIERLLQALETKFEQGGSISIDETLQVRLDSSSTSIVLNELDLSSMVDMVDFQPVIEKLSGSHPDGSAAKLPGKSPTFHRPGERVADSGIFDLVDENATYLNHQETLIEGQAFPEPLGDPRARGYVLRHRAKHARPPTSTFVPGEVVPYSGIYDVVDASSNAKGLQKTCIAGHRFPPMPDGVHGSGYALRVRAALMAVMHLPGAVVPVSGTYDVVDHAGLSLGHQRTFVQGEVFAHPPPELGELGYGWVGPA